MDENGHLVRQAFHGEEVGVAEDAVEVFGRVGHGVAGIVSLRCRVGDLLVRDEEARQPARVIGEDNAVHLRRNHRTLEEVLPAAPMKDAGLPEHVQKNGPHLHLRRGGQGSEKRMEAGLAQKKVFVVRQSETGISPFELLPEKTRRKGEREGHGFQNREP